MLKRILVCVVFFYSLDALSFLDEVIKVMKEGKETFATGFALTDLAAEINDDETLKFLAEDLNQEFIALENELNYIRSEVHGAELYADEIRRLQEEITGNRNHFTQKIRAATRLIRLIKKIGLIAKVDVETAKNYNSMSQTFALEKIVDSSERLEGKIDNLTKQLKMNSIERKIRNKVKEKEQQAFYEYALAQSYSNLGLKYKAKKENKKIIDESILSKTKMMKKKIVNGLSEVWQKLKEPTIGPN